jgi:excinuclease UvrABC nuclease subunit
MKALLEEMNEKHSEALTNHDAELAAQYRGEIERLEDLHSIM